MRRLRERVSPKMPYMEKIDGALRLRRLCKAFDVSFEPFNFYKSGKRFSIASFSGAERILVRTNADRIEFDLSKEAPNQLQQIESRIKAFVGNQPFIVQSVRSRASVSLIGGIGITVPIKGARELRIYEEPPSSRTSIYGASAEPHKIQLSINPSGKLIISSEGRRFLIEKTGNQNLPIMLEHVLSKLRGVITLKYVKYLGNNTALFYDLLHQEIPKSQL